MTDGAVLSWYCLVIVVGHIIYLQCQLSDVSWWGGRMVLCCQGLRWNVWMPAYHFHCRIGRTPRPVYALARRRHRLTSPLEGCQVIQLRESLCWGTRMGNQFQWLRTWRVIVIWGDFEGGVVSLALRVAIFNAVHNRRQDSLMASFHFNSALTSRFSAVQRFGVYLSFMPGNWLSMFWY